MIGQKRWEQITSGEDLDRNFDEAAFENAMNKAARQLETRTEVVSKSVPDFVTLNLLSDLKQVRKEKRKLGEMYGTLAEVMPDVVRLCGILDLVCEPVFVTESGSVSEFTVEKDRAQVPVALKSLSKKTRHLQFRKVDGVWKIDSLGYGRWLSAQFEPD